jgi:hypothetical protein
LWSAKKEEKEEGWSGFAAPMAGDAHPATPPIPAAVDLVIKNDF